jgi:hypothetical protein
VRAGNPHLRRASMLSLPLERLTAIRAAAPMRLDRGTVPRPHQPRALYESSESDVNLARIIDAGRRLSVEDGDTFDGG